MGMSGCYRKWTRPAVWRPQALRVPTGSVNLQSTNHSRDSFTEMARFQIWTNLIWVWSFFHTTYMLLVRPQCAAKQRIPFSSGDDLRKQAMHMRFSSPLSTMKTARSASLLKVHECWAATADAAVGWIGQDQRLGLHDLRWKSFVLCITTCIAKWNSYQATTSAACRAGSPPRSPSSRGFRRPSWCCTVSSGCNTRSLSIRGGTRSCLSSCALWRHRPWLSVPRRSGTTSSSLATSACRRRRPTPAAVQRQSYVV